MQHRRISHSCGCPIGPTRWEKRLLKPFPRTCKMCKYPVGVRRRRRQWSHGRRWGGRGLGVSPLRSDMWCECAVGKEQGRTQHAVGWSIMFMPFNDSPPTTTPPHPTPPSLLWPLKKIFFLVLFSKFAIRRNDNWMTDYVCVCVCLFCCNRWRRRKKVRCSPHQFALRYCQASVTCRQLYFASCLYSISFWSVIVAWDHYSSVLLFWFVRLHGSLSFFLSHSLSHSLRQDKTLTSKLKTKKPQVNLSWKIAP